VTPPKKPNTPATPTTRQIAEACGLSQAAVSFALRNSPEVSKATRARVQAAAKSMGWKPNPLVSAYMAHFRSTVQPHFRACLAWLISDPESGDPADFSNFDQRCYTGATQRAREIGYTLEPVWLHESGMNGRRLSKVLKSRGIPGMLIPGIIRPENPEELWRQLDLEMLAAVTIGFCNEKPALSHVLCNVCHRMELSLNTLRQLGYRRISMIVSDWYDRYLNHSLLYPFFYRERKHPADEWVKSYVFPSSRAFEHNGVVRIEVDSGSRANIRHWLEKHKPEVVIGEAVVWDVIEKMGWKVPDDIAFVSPDWSPRFPHVGGINQRPELLGSLAVDLLWAQLLQNERGIPTIPKSLHVEGQWQDGDSIPNRVRAGKDLPKIPDGKKPHQPPPLKANKIARKPRLIRIQKPSRG